MTTYTNTTKTASATATKTTKSIDDRITAEIRSQKLRGYRPVRRCF